MQFTRATRSIEKKHSKRKEIISEALTELLSLSTLLKYQYPLVKEARASR